MDVKIREWKFWWEIGYLYSLKGFYYELFINYKGGKSVFRIKKFGE